MLILDLSHKNVLIRRQPINCLWIFQLGHITITLIGFCKFVCIDVMNAMAI